jgi:predicted dehydrogenase
MGIIGAGILGTSHAVIYSGLDNARLVAVSDTNGSRARKLASEYGGDSYEDYKQMLKDESIDAVAVCTPDFAHRDPTVAAAEAGKHILVEKPLATSVKDGQDMIDAARKAGVKLMVRFGNRWNPPFVRAKEALDSGELGELEYLYIRLNDTIYVPTEMLSWAARSTVAWFLMSHTIDLARWYAKSEAKKAYGVSRSAVLTKRGVSTPDLYSAIVEFESGVVANLESLWVLPTSHPSIYDFKMEMVGTRGSVSVDTTERCVELYGEKQHTRPDTLGLVNLQGVNAGFMKESTAAFIKCVLDDKPVPTPGEDGLKVTKVIQAIEQSCQLGTPTEVSR